MDCRDARKLLEAYIAGELDGAGLTALKEHAAECGVCRSRMEEAERLEGALEALYRARPPVEGVMRRLLRRRRRRWRTLWLVLFLLVLLVVVLVAGLVAMRMHPVIVARHEVKLLLEGWLKHTPGGSPQERAVAVARSAEWASQRRLRRNAYLDPWTTPYRILLLEGVVRAVSAGPDRKFSTPDDIIAEGRAGKSLPRPNR